MSENASSGRKKVARVGVGGALIAALVLLVPWKRCGGMVGMPGGGDTAIEDTGKGVVSAPPSSDERPGPMAQPPRCQVRLDATGLTLAGAPAERAAVVAACKELGAADVVVTGDAAQGGWEALRKALDAAAVKTYVRGAPEAGADAGP